MLTDNLNMRLNYLGGNQKQRIDRAKLDSLKKALLYSYQSETLITEDGREFRCLINPDKLKNDYDNKFLLFGIPRPIARNNFSSLNLSIKFIKILFSFLEFLYAKISHFCRKNPQFFPPIL